MNPVIEITANPYLPATGILINGHELPPYSQLVQFTNERVDGHAEKIVKTLVSELREPFYLRFFGTEADNRALKFFCEASGKCLGYQAASFLPEVSLIQKMKRLDRNIRLNSSILKIKPQTMTAGVFLDHPFQNRADEFRTAEIQNSFVRAEIRVMDEKSDLEGDLDILFVFADSVQKAEQIFSGWKKRPARLNYLLGAGPKERTVRLDEVNRVLVMEKPLDDPVGVLFTHMLEQPLLEAFCKAVSEYPYPKKIQQLLSIYPAAEVTVPDRIEAGTSRQIEICSEKAGSLPEIVWHSSNPEIAAVRSTRLEGIAPGTVTIEASYKGEKLPFFSKKVSVYSRNRIQELIPEEDFVKLGTGDSYAAKVTWVPQNADNIQTIQWQSTDPEVAETDQNGMIQAKAPGECRIFCSAEQVSASFQVQVKPYLTEIYVEPEEIVLDKGRESEFKVTINPRDPINGSLQFYSENPEIADVIQNVIYARDKGDTVIHICTQDHSVEKTIEVQVGKRWFGKRKKKPKK